MLVDTTERKEVEERQQLLVTELNHRVRNTLAVVQAIAGQTLQHIRGSPAEFVSSTWPAPVAGAAGGLGTSSSACRRSVARLPSATAPLA